METIPLLLEYPVQRLLELLTPDGPRRLIALAGLPGSGKSTLAARLAAGVNAAAGVGTMAVIGMDGFHLPKAALRQMPDPEAAFARRGAPWTFDVAALAARLRAVRDSDEAAAVPWPEFEHGVGDPVEVGLSVASSVRLVLVEGLYLLCQAGGWGAVSRLFDQRWYLDTPLDVSMERLAQRHMSAWGLTRQAAEVRIAANDRLNAEIVLETRQFADWRVAG